MKNSHFALSILLILISFALIGCENDGNSNNTTAVNNTTATNNNTTAANNTNGSTTTPNNDTGLNNTTGSNNTVVPAGCDRGGFSAVREQATLSGGDPTYSAVDSETGTFSVLDIRSYADFNGPTSPGSYDLGGINYADCGLCLLINAGCEEGASSCEKTFYADEGTVDITALGTNFGDRFTANLQDIVFREVTIDDATYQSTPVEGGETWCIPEMGFDEELLDPSTAACADPNLQCVGDTIPNFELQNCASGEMVGMHTLTADSKALWIVATAGWCPACREWIPQVMDVYDAEKANGLEVIYVLGEDDNYEQPTLEYCAQYIQHYPGADLSKFYIDHDGQVAHATLFSNMWLYADANDVFGLPWNAIVDSMNTFIYADGSGEGTLDGALEQLLSAP